MPRLAYVTSLAALAWTFCAAGASADSFHIQRAEQTKIQFVSDAPLEVITGSSHDVSGALEVDPADVRTARGKVSVPVATLRTNVDLRDEHVRSESWLDAAHHPEAAFELLGCKDAAALRVGEALEAEVRGRFTIHGVTKPVVANATIRLQADGTLRVRATFRVKLTDYGVSVPSMVRLKVSDDIEVKVMLLASTGKKGA